MKKFKKIFLGALCFVLGASISLVGTLAFLLDETDTAYNVMTSGNVTIKQYELERNADGTAFVNFTKGKPADPAVYNAGNTDPIYADVNTDWTAIKSVGANALYADSIGNVVDHIVFVKNTGSNAAYIRTVIAIEAPVGLDVNKIHINTNKDGIAWETINNATIKGVNYLVMVATYEEAIAGGAPTAPSLLQLYLDPTTVNEDTELFGDTWDVLVLSQAVQTTGFQTPDGVLPADYALDKAFGDVNSINTPWDNKEITIPAVANDAAELRALLDVSSEIVVYGDMNAVGTVDVPSWTNAPAEFIFDATVVNKISGGNFVLDEASRYGIVARISADEYLSLSDMQITANSQWPAYLSNYGGNLVVSDVTIDAEDGAGIYPYGTNGTTVLNNVKVNQNRLDPAYSSSTPWAATAVATSNGHNLVINSGTYIGSQWAVYGYNSGSTITINGGIFKAPTVIQLDGVWSGTDKSVATINDGTFDGAIHLDWGNNVPELYIKGGTFTNFSATVYGAAKLVITGGTFDADPSAYVADGYIVVEGTTYARSATTTYTVLPIADETTFRLAMEKLDNIKLMGNVSIDADDTITIAEDTTKVIDLNRFTLGGISDDADKNDDGKLTSADNEVMFDVRGTLTVKNGNVVYQHNSDNFGWDACTEIFYVAFNGTLNVEKVTLDNLGGSDMAYCIDLVNATNITLDVNDSTLKSTYIPVRVFNNGAGMNNVTIKDTKLEGVSRAFWVHIYSNKDNGNKGIKDATLNLDIYGNGNTFVAKNPDRIIEFGFDDEINFDAEGNYVARSTTALQYMLDNAVTGTTIKLGENIDLGAATFTIPTDANVTIDLNGKTLTGAYSGADHYAMFTIPNGATLTVKGEGSVNASTQFTADNRFGAIFENAGNLMIDGGKYYLTDASEGRTWIIATIVDNRTTGKSCATLLTVNGGEFSIGGNAINLFRNYPQQGGSATIKFNGGVFKANPDKNTTYIWNQESGSNLGELYFNGGEFDSKIVYEDYNGQDDIHIADGVVINAYSGNN